MQTWAFYFLHSIQPWASVLPVTSSPVARLMRLFQHLRLRCHLSRLPNSRDLGIPSSSRRTRPSLLPWAAPLKPLLPSSAGNLDVSLDTLLHQPHDRLYFSIQRQVGSFSQGFVVYELYSQIHTHHSPEGLSLKFWPFLLKILFLWINGYYCFLWKLVIFSDFNLGLCLCHYKQQQVLSTSKRTLYVYCHFLHWRILSSSYRQNTPVTFATLYIQFHWCPIFLYWYLCNREPRVDFLEDF